MSSVSGGQADISFSTDHAAIPAAEGYTVIIKAFDKGDQLLEQRSLANVAFGQLLLCSGQSNMYRSLDLIQRTSVIVSPSSGAITANKGTQEDLADFIGYPNYYKFMTASDLPSDVLKIVQSQTGANELKSFPISGHYMNPVVHVLTVPVLPALNPVDPLNAKDSAYQYVHWNSVGDLRSAYNVTDARNGLVSNVVLSNTSLTCSYMADYLYNRLQVPVGIISASIGGTQIELWQPLRSQVNESSSSPFSTRSSYNAWLNLLPLHAGSLQGNSRPVCQGTNFFADPANPSNFLAVDTVHSPEILACIPRGAQAYSLAYNGMIAPLVNLNPGQVVWDQGEANASLLGTTTAIANYYNDLTNLMSEWGFGQPNAKFPVKAPELNLVQLSNTGHAPDAKTGLSSYSGFGLMRLLQYYALSQKQAASLTGTLAMDGENTLHYWHRDDAGVAMGMSLYDVIQNKKRIETNPVRVTINGLSAVITSGISQFTNFQTSMKTADNISPWSWDINVSASGHASNAPLSCGNDFIVTTTDSSGATKTYPDPISGANPPKVLAVPGSNLINLTLPASASGKITSITYGTADYVQCTFVRSNPTAPAKVQESLPAFRYPAALPTPLVTN
jgi:hypothetical protein